MLNLQLAKKYAVAMFELAHKKINWWNMASS